MTVSMQTTAQTQTVASVASTTDPVEWIRTKDAQQRFKTSRSLLYEWIAEGKIQILLRPKERSLARKEVAVGGKSPDIP